VRTFTTSIDISVPPRRVWAVMSDVERWHEWTPSVTSIRRIGGRPFGPGCRVVIRQPKFPPALWKMTEIDSGRSFSWVSPGPGFTAVARHVVEPAPAGSRATLSFELRGPLGGLFGRMTKGITERYLAFEAAGLKARSEDPGFRHDRRDRTV